MFFAILKRDLGLFCRCLAPGLALCLALAAFCLAAGLSLSKASQEDFTPINAAVVDGEDSLISRMLVSTVKGMEQISSLMSLRSMELEEARAALNEGEIEAIIVLPENFVEDILRGQQSRGEIILSSAAAASAEVVEGAARFGELMLAAGQYAVFSGEALISEYGLSGDFRSAFLEAVNGGLLDRAFEAGDFYFHTSVTGYAGTDMSTGAWYALNWLTLLLFLSAMAFGPLCRADMRSPMLRRLKSAGLSDGAFLFGKFALPTVFRALLLILAAWPLSGFLELYLSPQSLLMAVLSLISMGLVGSALCLSLPSGVGLTAWLGILGIFLCGGIVPRRMLPDWVLSLGEFSPFGAFQSLLAPLFGGEFSLPGLLLALTYGALALILSFSALKRLRMGGGDT